MCGIAGVINFSDINLAAIVAALRHRGPDDQAIWTDEKIALIQTRLAIQDIHKGTQPFHYGDHVIIFNGEIYNHQDLRSQLRDFDFKTNSDTETLLYLYLKYGNKCFDMIDGMFAFCIYDKRSKQLFLARDRVGKKPLYYFCDGKKFMFASELNALKSVCHLEILPDSIECYLRTGMIWRPYTPYKNTYKLAPGTYLELDTTSLKVTQCQYFNILENYLAPKSSLSGNDQLNLLDEKLRRSISDRISASDVEVGVFLSGGIDSNLVTAIAAQQRPRIKTFTVKFEGLYDESRLAKLTAETYKTEHIELKISPNLNHDIERILISYGEPFMDSSAIPSYYVSKEAAKYVKVVLGGDGADELFGGYRRYVPIANSLMKYLKVLNFLLPILPKPHTKQSKYNYLYRLITMSSKRDLSFYLSATTDVFEDVVSIKDNVILQDLESFLKKTFACNNLTKLEQMLYADFNIILFCDLLVKMDIASMASSLEVRSPFLSKYLLEFAPGLHPRSKVNRLQTKYILRQLAKKYLSQELINQPKRGFEVPLKQWVNTELREQIQDHLQPGCYAENFLDRDFINALAGDKLRIPAEKRAKMLWSLYCLEVWKKHEKNFSDRELC